MLFVLQEDEGYGFINLLKGFVYKRKQDNVDFGIIIIEKIKLGSDY